MDEESEAWTVANCAESWGCGNVDPNHSTVGPEYHILTVYLSALCETGQFLVSLFLLHVNYRRYSTAYGRRTDALDRTPEQE